ncbi:MAG: SGNH/GDSL hydrolase family protein [Pseudomonadota bacterium]|nr:SGNH/GDSL hydrolase family protein [Pseudomonadota bacterium]
MRVHGRGAGSIVMRVGLGVAIGASVLVVAEVLARGQPVPGGTSPLGEAVEGSVLLSGDPWLLWSLRPGDHEEVGVPVHVNTIGMRDRDRGEKRGPRVLAVGDSSVYGFGVRDDEVFTAVLERGAGGAGQGATEWVNAAVPGYSTFQTLNLLDMRGLALAPDLLVVGNLWSDNNFDSFTDRDLLASYAGWQASPSHSLRMELESSGLFRWLDWTLRVAPQRARAHKVGWQVGGDDPRTGTRRVDIGSYAANLEAMCARMYARGGGVVFLLLANREDVEPLSHDPAWAPYRQVMREVAARWGAALAEAPPAFQASGRSADALFLDQMHPTPLGHRILASAVDEALTARGWPERAMTLTKPVSPLVVPADPFEGRGREEPAGNVPGGIR